jgi:hypothetical protein
VGGGLFHIAQRDPAMECAVVSAPADSALEDRRAGAPDALPDPAGVRTHDLPVLHAMFVAADDLSGRP